MGYGNRDVVVSLRGLVILCLFGLGGIAAFANPIWGLLGYLGHYYLWPERQWWGQILAASGIRFSLTFALITIAASLVRWDEYLGRDARSPITRTEIVYWTFVAWVAITSIWSARFGVEWNSPDSSLPKLVKIGIICFFLMRIVNSESQWRRVVWFMFLVGGVYLGWLAREVPSSSFAKGRLNDFGGPDFSDSNAFAVHMVSMGVLGLGLVLVYRKWLVRLGVLAGGAFVANAYILTESRGATVALIGGGVAILFLVERRMRPIVIFLLVLTLSVSLTVLVNQRFMQRIRTTFAGEEYRDASAASRLEIWQASARIVADHPFGVGVDRFFDVIGDYEPKHAGRDAHNTYLRCGVELGVPGLLLFGGMIVVTFRSLRRTRQIARQAELDDWLVFITGMEVVLIVNLLGGLTITLLYVESPYHYLFLSACIEPLVVLAADAEQTQSETSGVVA